MKLTIPIFFLLSCLMGAAGPANRGHVGASQARYALLTKVNPLLKQVNYMTSESLLARLRIRKV